MAKGLYNKYKVINNETGEEVEGCFVLKPKTDVAARLALLEYAKNIYDFNPQLAWDLVNWLKEIRTEKEALNATNK